MGFSSTRASVTPASAQTLTNKTLTAPLIATAGPDADSQHTFPNVASDTLALLAAAQTFTNKTLTSPAIASAAFSGTQTGTITLASAVNLATSTGATGTKIAASTSQKIAFWNATPVIQPASVLQAAVAVTGAINVTPYGFTTAAQADGIVALLNEIRLVLVTIGLMKGAA